MLLPQSKNQYLNYEDCYSNLKTDISILKKLISILKIIFEPKDCYSNSETFYLNLKINISISIFKYEFLNLLVFFKFLCLSINYNSNYENYISTLKLMFQL
jgi:hypothetical protein